MLGAGKGSHKDRIERSEEREQEDVQNVRHEASMCYLRGLCFAKRNAFDRARDCYKDAVRIDVQCYEAFHELMKNSLMSPSEELEFLNSLDFDSITVPDDPSTSQEAAQFTRLLYTTRLSKYSSPAALLDATEQLSSHYRLADNPDLLLSRAEMLYTQCRFHEALTITRSILDSQSSTSEPSGTTAGHLGHNPTLYPLHLACLYETASINELFLLSHTLADNAPHESYTYLAIGIYYLSISKVADARRFFSKASLMDPHSAPAWIGFAHTFAAEGEHDQAIAAYSTAARLFQGSHLPQLFLGMQHLALNNMSLAHEYLSAAHAMSSGSIKPSDSIDIPLLLNPEQDGGTPLSGDPLVLNELGVILYHQNHLSGAVKLFQQSLIQAAALSCSPTAWLATRANLAHAFRRLARLEDALAEFDECLRVSSGGGSMPLHGDGSFGGILGLGPTGSGGGNGAVGGYEDRNLVGSIYTSRGLVLLGLGRAKDAVVSLHEAVRVLGGDASGGGIAGTLLGRAVEIWSQDGDESPKAAREPRDIVLADEDGGGDVDQGLDRDADMMLGRVLKKGGVTSKQRKGKGVATSQQQYVAGTEPDWMSRVLSSPPNADSSGMMGMSDEE